jgi:hypothetical protein
VQIGNPPRRHSRRLVEFFDALLAPDIETTDQSLVRLTRWPIAAFSSDRVWTV